MKIVRTLLLWVSSMLPVSLTSSKLISAAGASVRRRYCIASSISTPAAPPPTTAIRRGACWRTVRSQISSQAGTKCSTGFTGTACSGAPGVSNAGERAPVSTETTSYGSIAPFSQNTRRASGLIPLQADRTKWQLAKRVSRIRSMWHSSRV